MAEEQTDLVRFSDIVPDTSDFQLPLLAELLDQEFTIDTVRFENGSFGEFAIVTTDKGVFRISSKVVLKQLHAIEDMLITKNVRATLRKRKRYYILE